MYNPHADKCAVAAELPKPYLWVACKELEAPVPITHPGLEIHVCPVREEQICMCLIVFQSTGGSGRHLVARQGCVNLAWRAQCCECCIAIWAGPYMPAATQPPPPPNHPPASWTADPVVAPASFSHTSSPTPPSLPRSSAAITSSLSMRPPRDTFSRMAPSFIMLMLQGGCVCGGGGLDGVAWCGVL